MLKLTINGDGFEFKAPLTVDGLARALELDPRKVAVERNLEIVPKSVFATTMLADGDRIEIVHFVGGG